MTRVNADIEHLPKNPMRLEHIDMLRGLASGFVVCGHLRAYVFTNFGALSDSGIATKAFYAVTGLGHQAVIIFFAMSGFLVGGKALDDMLVGRWCWSRYLLRRSTRLLIVVAPALLATALLDGIGIGLTGGAGYDGSFYGMYASGPQPNEPLDYSAATFFGNLAFLQTIYVPIFGTNGPMWSLANEFWYYIVCPVAASVLLVRYRVTGRLLAIGLLTSSIVLLPWWLWEGGLIWTAGAVAAWLTKIPLAAPVIRNNSMRVLVFSVPIAALIFGRVSQGEQHDDLVFGFSVAFALPIMAMLPSFGNVYRSLARAGAEISYTLYLTHFPFLTLIVLVELTPFRFQPSLLGVAIYLGLLTSALAWAVVFWWCFERHTDHLFRFLSARLLAGRGMSLVSEKLRSER